MALARDLRLTCRLPNLASWSKMLIGTLSAIEPTLADEHGPVPTRQSKDPMLHGSDGAPS
jgi:hypothetical protein